MTEKAGATAFSFTGGSPMERRSADNRNFRTMQASMPMFWRRHLGALRFLLGFSVLLVHVTEPVLPPRYLLPPLALYTVLSAYAALRSPAWSFRAPLLQLAADMLLFLAAAVHPSSAGVWLSASIIAWLMTEAGLLYRWPLVLTFALIEAVAFAFAGSVLAKQIWPAIAVAGCMSTVLAVQRKTMEDRLAVALRRSVLSRSEAELAREQERQRIAGDFHDGPLQSFISFQMRLEIIRKLMARDVEQATKELVLLQDLGRAQVTELRAFVRGMQPVDVTPMTLTTAVREAVEHFERDSGINTELFCGNLSSLDVGMTMDVLQIIREILNNARKHSKASKIRLEIEPDGECLRIRAEDDGSGFPFSGTYTLEEMEVLRLGPKSIQRRVRTLGGEMKLRSKPTQGVVLQVQIPMSK